jgi:RNA-directed DNA polymerase
MVKSARAADRVLASLTRYVEGQLKLVVNRVKSQAAPRKQCPFLGFQLGARGNVVWTTTAQARFKRRVKEIPRHNRGHRVQDVIDELRRYVTAWLHYFRIRHTYTGVLELEEWGRRRVRVYYWKQWKRLRSRRRRLLALGTASEEIL